MKLTEAKLKQMIAEALKNKSLQDLESPTQMKNSGQNSETNCLTKFKVSTPEQAEMFNQSFDSDYPRSLKRETFASLLEPYGFKQKLNRTVLDNGYMGSYKFETYERESKTFYVRYKPIYSRRDKKSYIEYVIEIADYGARSAVFRDRGDIEISDMFELDVRNDEDVQTIVSLIINKTGEQIIKAIETNK